MIVHPVQPLRHQYDEALSKTRVLCTQTDNLTLRVRDENDVLDGFSRQTMPGQFHEGEKIAWEKELHNLAPAIGQMLAEANSAAQQSIGMLRRVTFVENCLIVIKPQSRSDVSQRDEVSVRPREYSLTIAGKRSDRRGRGRPRRFGCFCDLHVFIPLHSSARTMHGSGTVEK